MSYGRNPGYQNDPYAQASADYPGPQRGGYGGYSTRGAQQDYYVEEEVPQDSEDFNNDNIDTGEDILFDPDEQTLMKYYLLKTLNPTSWKDSTANEFSYNPEETEDVDKAYEILKSLGEDSTSTRTQILDEPDPLGYFSSVSQALRQKGIITNDNDPNKQNYLVGSKTFNPILFLKHLHDADSFDTLNQSLDYLESSIAQQSQQLRHLIKKEFIRFVKSKSSLDNVFDQITSSGLLNGPNIENDSSSSKSNPLHSLSNNLTLANSKASVIIKPIVDNKKKENNLKSALDIVEKNKYLFDLPRTLTSNIETKDYESLSINYNKGRDLYYALMNNSSDNTAIHLATKRLLDRVWEEVRAILDSYKKDLWNKLADTNSSDSNYVGIISKLLELGVEDNPILVWINTQFNNLTNEITTNFEKLFENIISAQKHIFETTSFTDITFIYYLKGMVVNDTINDTAADNDKLNKLSHGLVDSPEIIEMWLIIKKLIEDTIVLSSTKVKQYWNVCELFLSNRIQATLPKGYQNESAVHLKLANYEKERIVKNGEELINLVCKTFEKFLRTTQDDLANLSIKNKLNNEIDTYEIKSPKHYGFIPPFANSISTIRYLEKFMTSVFLSYNTLGNLNISANAVETLRGSYSKVLKKFIIGICSTWSNDVSFFNTLEDYIIANIKNELNHSNDLIISNITEAKSNYISSQDIDSNLTLPELILIYEKFVIKNLRDILYVDLKLGSNVKDSNNIKIFTKPDDKFFASIHSQFLKSLEYLLISMMKKVTNENKGGKEATQSQDSINGYGSSASATTKDLELLETRTSTLDLYELWTLDNFIELEDKTLGQIISYFDEVFKTKFSRSTNLDIYTHLLPKLQKATFNNYCDLKKQTLTDIIRNGISKIQWTGNTAPKRSSSYIYECLVYLVILHSTIAKVSKSLIYTIVHELQNHITTVLYETLKSVKEFSVPGLQQAAVDVEFFKRIFKKQNYKLGKTASANLNLIVLKIIKSRSDPEMIINSIDGLVESSLHYTKFTFACFYDGSASLYK